MRNREVSRQLQKLRSLIAKTRQVSVEDIELQAHWARYLCVLTAGFIENSFGEIYVNFVRRAASEPVASYAESMILRIQNPKTQIFIETASKFKEDWGEDLQVFVDSDGRKEAINSIMSNRHLIAHGNDSGITVAQVTTYLEKVVEVLEFIEEQCSH